MTDRVSILDHLEELRWRLVKSSAAIVAGAVVALFFKDFLVGLMVAPYSEVFPDAEMTSIVVTEEFSVVMRTALFGGLLIASPILTYQMWAFINPALTKRERRWTIPLVAAFVLLFAAGVAFAYAVLPRGLEFLLGVLPEVTSALRIGDYVSFVVRFLLVFGFAFEFPLVLFAAAAAGLVTSDQLARGRRWAVLGIVVVGAAVTPTGDPLTLLAFSGPLYVFYEATLLLVKLILHK